MAIFMVISLHQHTYSFKGDVLIIKNRTGESLKSATETRWFPPRYFRVFLNLDRLRLHFLSQISKRHHNITCYILLQRRFCLVVMLFLILLPQNRICACGAFVDALLIINLDCIVDCTAMVNFMFTAAYDSVLYTCYQLSVVQFSKLKKKNPKRFNLCFLCSGSGMTSQ